MKGFKKCSNGHWYKDDVAQCPYCQGGKNSRGNETATISNSGNEENTQVFSGLNDDGNKTMIISGEKNPNKIANHKQNLNSTAGLRTEFEEEFEEETEQGGVVVKKERRTDRRLVGWLVTYSIDPMGIDYKIYEGRNMIGKHIDCNITVNDKKLTDRHALILFRSDEYVIQDQLSTHGTFVNDEDIKYNPIELHDGDIIRMGDTIFKFKTSF